MHSGDIDAVARKYVRNIAQQTRTIVGANLNVEGKPRLARGLATVPGGLENTLGRAAGQFSQTAAIRTMDRNPSPARYKPLDGVGWHGPAATRELRQHIDAHHQHPGAGNAARRGARGVERTRRPSARNAGERLRIGNCSVLNGFLVGSPNRLLERTRADFLARHRQKQSAWLGKTEALRQRFKRHDRAPFAGERPFDKGASAGNVALNLERVEPLTHLCARTLAREIAPLGIQPIARRPILGVAAGQHFHRLTVAQRRIERNQNAIDARAATAMPELGV